MNILLGGAFGHLGFTILKDLLNRGHKVTGADKRFNEAFRHDLLKKRLIDVTEADSLKHICDDIDIVISAIGLTNASSEFTHEMIDYQGNINLLREAERAGVKKLIYISSLDCDTDNSVPILRAKSKFEKELIKSDLDYTIYRPTSFFYNIGKAFKIMVDKGEVKLVKGVMPKTNMISVYDFSNIIVQNLNVFSKEIIEAGGKEIYSFEEIAKLFFIASGKKEKITYISPRYYDFLALASRVFNNGNYANIKYGKWIMSNDLESNHYFGADSFDDYVKDMYKKYSPNI